MVFSSPLFLFLFLPATLAGYFLTPPRGRNLFLLAASLAFYLVGAGGLVVLLLLSIAANFAIALGLPGAAPAGRKALLALAVVVNLAPLLVWKYAAFAATSLNAGLAWLTVDSALPVPELFLPAGISFFSFQGLAYVIDVYRGDVPPARSLVDYGLFKAFFPQLIAGPILRYGDLARELAQRSHSLAAVADGFTRFGLGLAKKVLLADSMGRVADTIFEAPASEWSAANAWLGLACYTFQIFFDFSGYSDMAIGLGRVCGLTLPENFRQPYRATSVTEFWRRWHITLSTWFRDYLYIPLGGNRRGPARLGLNLLAVFVLCGLWHGANFTFVAWGLWHGALLAGEKLWHHRTGRESSGVPGWLFTTGAVMLGWVVFRSDSLAQAGTFFQALVGVLDANPVYPAGYHLTPDVIVVLVIATVVALWPAEGEAFRRRAEAGTWVAVRPWCAAALFFLAVVFQSPRSFNPFIYFQF